ncbi:MULTISPECIES: type II toxin-antitoxin system YafO family toxin [Vibrio]|nr:MULTISPECIES: type II toxin-antitoxin system YafO family toxin [Vibrio]EKO3828885.1 type II toxin-antitoxin system YafO family toxin [Vibrio harveyi]EKO3860510.1 type II toxin-antitoxin system YafO family toxin [Vibrio harveyi]EKO3871359.1 type II toxin-antitoxin system YafO family toxin [Vibrio harveyi]ELI0637543.1 type II toxin-antitoxin system YafO family toxin [Vibrio harveyi]ELV8724835.1 type II toxin-antitoxin system YafO family toxin [Vibrio harveyi]
MDVKIYVTRALSEERKLNKDLDLLIHDFKRHKQGHRISYFGKEVPYHRPAPAAEDAGLMHIHILDKIKTLKLGQSDTSDSVLIYTEGATSINTYFIIDFLVDGAHAQARRHEYMSWLIDKAEAFRNQK